jgi:C-type mannose receptor
MYKAMKSEFDSSSTHSILEIPRDGKNNQTKSRIKCVLGAISVGLLGLILGFALAYVMINKENQIRGQQNIKEEKEPGKLICENQVKGQHDIDILIKDEKEPVQADFESDDFYSNGFVYANKYYRFSNVTKSFDEAQGKCASKGGKLFEPRNLQQNNKVADFAHELDGYKNWWIGVDDKEKEGIFQWSKSKQNINFSNWRSGQPNNLYGNEDCVDIYTTSSSHSEYHGKWFDSDCNNIFRFICEFS